MLERMSEFFEKRLVGYDEHMLTNIESAAAFYPFTASLLPTAAGAEVLQPSALPNGAERFGRF